MGSGKTTIANQLHTKLPRTALLGLDRIKWFVSGFKRNKASNLMTQNVVVAMVNEYLRQGINVIVEQAFKPAQVLLFKKLAKKNKVNFFIYQLSAPRQILLGRIRERAHQKTDRPKIAQSRILRNLRLFEKNTFPKVTKFETHLLSAKQITERILKVFSRHALK